MIRNLHVLISLGKSDSFSGIFLIILFAMLAGCENDIEKIKLITDKDIVPVESSSGLEILYSDSARVAVKIVAPEMNRYDTGKAVTVLPMGLHIEFYDPALKVVSTLDAKYAIRHDTEQLMEARDSVVVVNDKNEKLQTEKLIWNEREETIYSDEFVTITTADKVIYGEGFEANQDFTNYRIFKIRGTITIQKDERTKDS
jgi:lipopolysaccharide export system protein LptC